MIEHGKCATCSGTGEVTGKHEREPWEFGAIRNDSRGVPWVRTSEGATFAPVWANGTARKSWKNLMLFCRDCRGSGHDPDCQGCVIEGGP